jgi:hypothetical protein
VKPKEDSSKKTVRVPEPEEFERAVSEFLYSKALEERRKLAAMMTLKAEDISRVAHVAEGSLNRLLTAARGSAEEFLVNWRQNADGNVRSQLSDATAENIQQKLASLEEYQWQSSSDGKSALWDQAVSAELSPEVRALWEKELNARVAFREVAIAALITVEFERKHALTSAQLAKLQPQVAQILKDYRDDFDGYFSSSDSSRWYLQTYSMFMPIAGIPEGELKATLSKEQWESWTTSNEYSNATQYWQNVKENHERRQKAKKGEKQ